MRRFFLAAVCLALFASCSPESTDQSLVLTYDKPSEVWTDALPVGNGHIGAMIYGDATAEHLQLNENTLYSGEPSTAAWKGTRIRPTFDQVMSLMKEGRKLEASEIVRREWLGVLHQSYMPMTDLYIDSSVPGEVSDYCRTLDISNSVSTVSYTQNGVGYTREVIASHPDDVIAIRLSADKKGSVSFKAHFGSQHPTAVQSGEGNLLVMKGQAPGLHENRSFENLEAWGTTHRHPYLFNEDGTRKTDKLTLYGDEIEGRGMFFDSRIKVDAKGGSVTSDSDGLTVEGADEVVIYLSAATSFNGWNKSPSREGVDASAKAASILDKAAASSWKEIKKRHTEDYKALFDRVSLNLPSDPALALRTTDERIDSFAEDKDQSMITLLYQFGRYLMISGSRPGGQPLNLQGMWNDSIQPPWCSAYTININTEMNYWPAEVTGLSECAEPLFTMIGEVAESGAETARDMYGLDGWMAHHNVSIWRETFPNDNAVGCSYWPMAGGWLTSHLWEHWLFTGDEQFLREKAYPLMKGAATFYKGWLIEDEDGYLVTPLSTTPENTYVLENGKTCSIDQGTTMDMSIIRENFTRVVEAARHLGVDKEFADEIEAMTARLLPFRIGARGQLQEWAKDYVEAEPQHRHMSHLYGFHPGNQITWAQTPDLVKAVRRTLELRGDAATGWSMGWKINHWARMQDGDHAFIIVSNLLNPIGFGTGGNGGGVYKNLFDAHPPFQIDGNFGFTAGISEMLLQSHQGFIQMLPARPSVWPEGSISGLHARGNFICSMQWAGGKLTAGTVESVIGKPCTLVAPVPFKVAGVTAEPYELAGKTLYKATFETEAGKTYKLSI